MAGKSANWTQIPLRGFWGRLPGAFWRQARALGRDISEALRERTEKVEMATFVLVPGGWQGGWMFDGVATQLRSCGHHAEPLTLPGLGDTPAPTANLTTHIDAAVQAIRSLGEDIVLVGHSYGGMVVTGAADTAPSRLRALVYSDAYVPDSGDSCWSLTTQRFRDVFAANASADGLTCVPPTGSDPRCRPHPIGTFLQAIELTGRWREVPRKVFLGAHGWKGSPFLELFDRLRVDPQWSTHSFDCGHNIARLKPEALVEVLLAQV